ncbi:YqiA/YcfP family alpha/beta fold hydrolase [Chloroflexota bacterium]
MGHRDILFLHGFASSSKARKAKVLGAKLEAFPNVAFHAVELTPTPVDFEYMTTTGLIDRLRQYVLDHELGLVDIVGSSYGGLIALHYARRFAGVGRMLLLAPGLFWLSGGLSDEDLEHWQRTGVRMVDHFAFEARIPVTYDLQVDGLRYLEPIPPASQTLIIHGRRDITVPIEYSRNYAASYPERVSLLEIDADHDLNNHLDLVWQYVQSFLLGIDQGGA